MKAYAQLEKHFARLSALRGASGMLHWDSSVMLPAGASDVRGEQLAALAETTHEMIVDKRLADLLSQAEQEVAELNPWQQANLKAMRHQWKHENAVNTDLVGALSRACTESEAFWRTARKANDYASFKPYQQKVLELVREVANAKAEAFGCSPYDAMLDSYDPGTKSTDIDVWFDDLRAFLPGFTQEVMEHQARKNQPIEPQGPFAVENQKALGIACMKALGFDFDHGRLDVSLHPFCGGVPGDVRITTRYRTDNFTESFFGVLHETGHALYELDLPADWRNQPVGEARGMSMHESQSLLVEMQLSRGLDFLHFAAPLIREHLGVSDGMEPANLHALMTRVKPGFIRVSADEVTYPSHVILRYRLERAMLDGSLNADGLPEAWREGMRELLGVVPDTDADGCMQDIHWPDGSFGYFPTYTMGAMTAAQLFAAARKAMPDLSATIRAGNFAPLIGWLRENVHEKASSIGTQEIIKKATGSTLTTAAFKDHLRSRYLS